MPYKKADGRWLATPIVGGKRVKQRTFKRKKDALDWERAVKSEARKQPTGSGVLGLYELAADYLEDYRARWAASSFRGRSRGIRTFLEWVGEDIPVDEVDVGLVQRFLVHRAETVSKCSANTARMCLDAMWRWGEKHRRLEHNPVRLTARFAHSHSQGATPTEEEVARLLSVANPFDRVWILTYLHTLGRREEINRLKWEDIDFDAGRVTLWSRKTHGKGWEPQRVALTKTLAEALVWLRDVNLGGDAYIFERSPGVPFANRIHALKALGRRAGVENLQFHGLRRYGASLMAKRGVPLQTIQHMLRHKSLAVTERYITGLGVDLTHAVSVLDENYHGTTISAPASRAPHISTPTVYPAGACVRGGPASTPCLTG